MVVKIKIRKSVIIVGSSGADEAVRRFDLSTATPMACFDFLRKLKEKDGNEETPRL